MSFMSIIRFEIKPGMEESFLSAFNEGTEFERQQEVEGFQSSVMCRSLEDDPVIYYVVGHWETEAAYTEWGELGPQVAPEVATRLMGSVVDPAPGKLFKIVRQTN